MVEAQKALFAIKIDLSVAKSANLELSNSIA